MSQPSQVIVLAEDKTQQRFARNYLYNVGYKPHDLRFEPLPAGGSGEQFVKEHYPEVVRAFRRRAVSKRATTALVVVIDADTNRTEYRLSEFRRRLHEAGEAPIQRDERIAHVIPKRHIETWILFLQGSPVDEVTDCKRQHHGNVDQFLKPAAEALRRWYQNPHQRPPNCLPSLLEAITELDRLDIS